jgi:hypothetical protein
MLIAGAPREFASFIAVSGINKLNFSLKDASILFEAIPSPGRSLSTSRRCKTDSPIPQLIRGFNEP